MWRGCGEVSEGCGGRVDFPIGPQFYSDISGKSCAELIGFIQRMLEGY